MSKTKINWYRSPLDKELQKNLNERSDWKGWLQAGGYGGLLVLTGGLALYSAARGAWWATLLLVFVHGTFFSTMSSAVHELIHRTVFKTRWLNDWWARIFSFFSWASLETFHPSHMKHHQHTLHAPDDLEVVLPMNMLFWQFMKIAFINPLGFWNAVKTTLRIARGRFEGEWENHLFPDDEPEKQRGPVQWARFTLAGHALIVVASLLAGAFIAPHWWLLPVLTTLTPGYGAWLIVLLGAPQHMGMQDETSDYRLCCRTYTVNPFCQFLYWHMNFHIEHHMFAAVPCYNLSKLHQAIKHDLPECPHGIIATWRQITEIQQRQKHDPDYCFVPQLPGTPAAPIPEK